MKILAGRLPKAELFLLSVSIHNSLFTLIPHVLERLTEKNITKEEIYSCIKIGKVIELHDEQGAIRCLLRDGNGICVVLELPTKAIITAYKNSLSDKHNTLRREEYFWGPITKQIVRKFTRVGL